jgi:hypothetical protein
LVPKGERKTFFSGNQTFHFLDILLCPQGVSESLPLPRINILNKCVPPISKVKSESRESLAARDLYELSLLLSTLSVIKGLYLIQP